MEGHSNCCPEWQGAPCDVPGHIPCLVRAIRTPWHLGLLAPSILSQNRFLLSFLQLNELRAMMGSVGQEQGESQAVCPDRSSDSKLVRKLLHRCEKLQEQVDSLVPQQVQRSLPQKTQVGSWQHGGAWEAVSGPLVWLCSLQCRAAPCYPTVWFGQVGSMAGN